MAASVVSSRWQTEAHYQSVTSATSTDESQGCSSIETHFIVTWVDVGSLDLNRTANFHISLMQIGINLCETQNYTQNKSTRLTCVFSRTFLYLTGLGSTLQVGNDLHCDHSICFFLHVKRKLCSAVQMQCTDSQSLQVIEYGRRYQLTKIFCS